jgi:hypothetical protein
LKPPAQSNCDAKHTVPGTSNNNKNDANLREQPREPLPLTRQRRAARAARQVEPERRA